MKKNILIITTWFPNKYDKTKCIFTKNILDFQAKSSTYKFTVIVPRPYFPNFNFKWIPIKYKKYQKLNFFDNNGHYEIYRPFYIKIPFLRAKFFLKLYYYCMLYFIKKYIDFKVEAIHAHGIFPDSYIAIELGNKFNIPVICHFHDSGFLEMNKTYKKYVRVIIEKAHNIIAVSEFQKKTILNEYPNAKNIIIIKNGINDKEFHNISLGTNRKKFVFIGNLINIKGLDILIEAISELDKNGIEIELDIYGKGPNKAIYKERIIKLHLEKQIKFKGIIDNSLISTVLPNYSGLILPTRYETFGIVVVEAMSSGLFVVASNVGAIPELIINQNYGLLFEKNNINELKNCILKSLSIKWDRRLISKYGKSFKLDKVANEINQLYKI